MVLCLQSNQFWVWVGEGEWNGGVGDGGLLHEWPPPPTHTRSLQHVCGLLKGSHNNTNDSDTDVSNAFPQSALILAVAHPTMLIPPNTHMHTGTHTVTTGVCSYRGHPDLLQRLSAVTATCMLSLSSDSLYSLWKMLCNHSLLSH